MKFKIHELKILPQYFEDVKCGHKTFELRKDDREFQTGDILMLKEFNQNKKYKTINETETNFSGKKVLRQIKYILKDIEGLNKNYAILGIKPIDKDIELEWKSGMTEWGKIFCPMIDKEVMTYYPNGTPAYDTMTNPFIDEDGNIYYYEYDQDEGCWRDGVFGMYDAEEYINLNEVKF